MADPMEIAKTFGIPVFGAVAGWVTAAVKTAGRVSNLEVELANHRKAAKEQFDEYKAQVKEQFENLVKAWKLELHSQKEDGQKQVGELKEQLKELEKHFDLFTRASHHDFADNEAFTRFVEEMNRQWKVVERTLGHIEGWMKAQPKGPSTFPPTGMTSTRRG